MASVSVIDMETNDGEDYLLIDMPEAEAAPAKASPGIEIDPTITKETLDAQLAEMEKIMASLGLGAKQVSGTEAHAPILRRASSPLRARRPMRLSRFSRKRP